MMLHREMPVPYRFFITDVFAESPYSGNQLATFFQAGDLNEQEMQDIAQETNFSETTFVIRDEEVEGGYDVRIFTPGEEVPFAGHPTLGTAFLIHKHIVGHPVPRIVLNLKVGQIAVDMPADEDGVLWMHQKEPEFGAELEVKDIASALGLVASDIDERWPIQEVSTGLPQLMVPLRSMRALKAIDISRSGYQKGTEGTTAKTVLAFCPETYQKEETLAVWVFPIGVGIAEDPATGSGNGCLAAYLVKHRYLGSDDIDIMVGQGYEVGRPSRLYLRARTEGDSIKVSVGGKVSQVAEGRWGD